MEPSGNKGVRKSEISVTLKSSAGAVLYIFHEECAAVITMEHNLAYTDCVTDLKLMTCSPFIEILMILTNYVFNVGVWLTEYSVTVGSITLRFYCTHISL